MQAELPSYGCKHHIAGRLHGCKRDSGQTHTKTETFGIVPVVQVDSYWKMKTASSLNMIYTVAFDQN